MRTSDLLRSTEWAAYSNYTVASFLGYVQRKRRLQHYGFSLCRRFCMLDVVPSYVA